MASPDSPALDQPPARADTAPAQTPPPRTVPNSPPGAAATGAPRRWAIRAAGLVALLLILFEGVPWVRNALRTVSTDDAYVNGHVTFVAARVAGQVTNVLVDDNNRVQKGDLLVQLDKEPYQVQVNIAQAAVDAAQADLRRRPGPGARHRRPGAQPALQPRARDRGRGQSGRPPALAGRRPGLPEGHRGQGPGRLRPGAAAGQVRDAVTARGVRPPQGGAAGRAGQARGGAAGRLPGPRRARPAPQTRQPATTSPQVPPDLDQTFSTVRQAQVEADAGGRAARRDPSRSTRSPQADDRRLLQARSAGRHRSHLRAAPQGRRRSCKQARPSWPRPSAISTRPS